MMQSLLIGLALVNAGAAGAALNFEVAPERLPVDPAMQSFVDEAFSMIGLHNDVKVVIDPVGATGCAYATTRGGQQYIGFDPGCVDTLKNTIGYNWAPVATMLHEVGHLLSGHTTNGTHSHTEELQADEWSGWAMSKLGATLDEALTRSRQYRSRASESHPGRADRMAAVERGWRNGAPDPVLPTEKTTPGPAPTVAEPPRQTPAPRRAPPKADRWLDIFDRKLPWASSK